MTTLATQPHEAAAPSPPAVSLRGLTVVYPGGVRALDGGDLDIVRGRHTAVLGASGSGKTTLLRVLAGTVPAQGRVAFEGAKHRITTIHQDLRLVKQRTALANVLDGAAGRHGLLANLTTLGRHETDRARRLLNRVGLSAKLHVRVSRLSGGEQQRVAIARALMTDPTILLADEPVASLDAGNARAVMGLLVDLSGEHGLTLISVLHDCDLAETYADRILGFREGKLLVDEDRNCNGNTPCTTPAANGKLVQPTVRGYARFEACLACPRNESPPTPAVETPPANKKPVPFGLIATVLAIAVLLVASVLSSDIRREDTTGALSAVASFVAALVPESLVDLRSMPWALILDAMLVTLRMAFVGTVLAVLVSWPLAALAAANGPPAYVRWPVRFLLNVIRSVPSILWALLFVAAVGLGEFSGLLALVAYSLGYLTKFYYEAFENVDPNPPAALRELGMPGIAAFTRGVWPAARPHLLASSLFMLEYNVRAASVLGLVGGGGIGLLLKEYVDWRAFDIVGVILAMLVVVVLLLDALSTRLRARLLAG
ncbi:MAG: phosphonate ABC transporter, permease protein PhnE [Phycisphaerae bacterium]